MKMRLMCGLFLLGVLPAVAEDLALLDKELKQKFDAGRFAEAISIAEEIVVVRRAEVGEDDVEYGESLATLGELYAKMCRYRDAESILKKVVELPQETLRGLILHADSLHELGCLYLLTGDYDKSRDYLGQAKALRGETLGETHPDFAKSLFGLAELSAALGNQEIALSLHERALDIRRSALGERHADYAKSLHRLGAAYANLGRMNVSRPLFEAALAIQREVLDESHPDIAQSLGAVGLLCCMTGEFAKAEPLLSEAIKISKASFGKNHVDVAKYMSNLGYLYRQTGKFDLAEPLFEKALAVAREKHGDAHPDYADGLNNLAALYFQMGELEKAEPYFKKAMDIKRKTLPGNHPDLVSGIGNMGALYMKMEDYESAAPLLEKAVEQGRIVIGRNHPDYALYVGNLGAMYCCTGDYAKGEPFLREALAIQSEILEEHHRNRVGSMSSLADLLKKTGQYEEAEQLYKQIVQIRMKAAGKEHPDYAESLMALAELYMENRSHDRAVPLIEEAVVIWSKTGLEHSSSLAVGRGILGMLYFQFGQYAKAKPLLQEAVKMGRPGSDEERLLWVHVEGLSNLAILRASEGATEEAGLLLEEAVQIGREEPVAGGAVLVNGLLALGGLLSDRGEREKAEASFEEASELLHYAQKDERSEYLTKLSTLFQSYRRSSNHAKIVSVIDALIKRNPECTMLFVKRGRAHTDLAEYEEASKDFEKAFKLDPGNLESHHQRGHLYAALGEWKRAISDYSYVIEYGGQTSHLYSARGTAHMGQGDSDAALDDYEVAIETRESWQGIIYTGDPEYTSILNNLVWIYVSKNDHESAEPLLVELLELLKIGVGDDDPDYLIKLRILGMTYLGMGEYEKAKSHLESAAKMQALVLGEKHSDHAETTACLATLHLLKDAQAGQVPVPAEYRGSIEAELIELLELERLSGAMVAAREIVGLRRKGAGEDSALYAECLINMARFHLSKNDSRRAQPLLERALRIQRTLLGVGHPNLFETKELLEAIRRKHMSLPSSQAGCIVEQCRFKS
jgi:tetratricopeptide (TPR) repeat protein